MNIVVPSYKFDKYFIPLSTSAEIENHRNTKNKTEFNKFMQIEEKKEKNNEMVNNFVNEYKTKEKEILELKNKIELNDKLYIENVSKIHTFTGNLDEIRENVLNHSHEINVKYKIPNKNHTNSVNNLLQIITIDSSLLERNYLVNIMYIDVNKSLMEKEDTAKQDKKDTDWKRFLKNLDSLPDELLRIIRSYFTYQTRAALLEKYQPIKLFLSLKKERLMNVIYKIYKRKYPPKFAKNLKDKWNIFFKTNVISKSAYKSVTVKDLKIFIEYLFYILNKHGASRFCFKLYSAAVLYYTPQHQRS